MKLSIKTPAGVIGGIGTFLGLLGLCLAFGVLASAFAAPIFIMGKLLGVYP